MNAVLLLVVLVLVFLAAVVGGTGVLALLGRLPGNHYLGVRTPETRRDRKTWELANRAAGPAFLAAGAALLLGAIGLRLIGGWMGGLVVVVALVGTLVLLNVAGLAGARAAAVWQATNNDDDDAGCGCGPGGCGGGDHAHADGSEDTGSCSGPGAEGTGGAIGTGGAAGTGGASGSGTGADGTAGADPASDCGVTGGCGSCALQGMCESESAGR